MRNALNQKEHQNRTGGFAMVNKKVFEKSVNEVVLTNDALLTNTYDSTSNLTKPRKPLNSTEKDFKIQDLDLEL